MVILILALFLHLVVLIGCNIAPTLSSAKFVTSSPTFDYGTCNQYFNHGLWQLATDCYERGLAHSPRFDPAVYHNLAGVALHELRKFDLAVPHYTEATTLRPETAIYHYNLAMALANRPGEDQFLLSLKPFMEAIELEPNNSLYAFSLGNLFFNMGDYKGATLCYEIGVRNSPTDAGYWNLLGVVYAERRKYRKAVHCYRKAIQHSPMVAVYHFNLGMAVFNMKGLEPVTRARRAAQHLLRAYELDPYNPSYAQNVGNAYFNAKLYTNATKYYELSLQSFDPGYVNMMSVSRVERHYEDFHQKSHHFARIDEITGKYSVARHSPYFTDLSAVQVVQSGYQEAIRAEPHNAVYYFNVANLAFQQQELEKAGHYASLSVDKEPDNDVYRHFWGTILLDDGRYIDAVEQFEIALLIDPSKTDYLAHLGQTLHKLERYNEAVEIFRRACALEPLNANLRQWLATSMLDGGNWADGVNEWRQGIALDDYQGLHYIKMDAMMFPIGSVDDSQQNFTDAVI